MKKNNIRLTSVGKKIIIFLTILFIVGIGAFEAYKGYKIYLYHQTYEYKFLQINYSLDEFKILNNKLKEEELVTLLDREYNENIPLLVNEKYFMFKNLDRYLNYKNLNKDKSYSNIVSLVNVNRDKDYYTDLEVTDVSENETMLVNKYHALDDNYEAKDIVNASTTYAYANQKLNKEAYEAFKNLANDAKKEGYTILILSSYRTYDYQKKLWEDRKNSKGEKAADNYAARAGASEHETGYAIDVADYYDKNDSFKDTEAYKWMINNSYKYGFILRYPEGAEDITGYKYESWHYRYLGVDLATKVYNEGITFDEYYEFYLNS